MSMAELAELRKEIDEIDEKIQRLFEKRMDISAKIAGYKASCGMPVFDEKREEDLIRTLRERAPDARSADGIEALYRVIMQESRAYQEALNKERI